MYTYFTPVTDGECEVIQMAAAITFEAFGQVSYKWNTRFSGDRVAGSSLAHAVVT